MEKVAVWAQRRAFQRLTEPVDRTEFGTSSATVNAFYSAIKNAISKLIAYHGVPKIRKVEVKVNIKNDSAR